MLRSLKLLPFAVLLVFAGCNNDPQVYRVALDMTPLNSLPGSCYNSGSVPTGSDTATNTVAESQWVIWVGSDGEQYLEMGSVNFHLGDAPAIDLIGDAIKGGPTSFITERTRVTGGPTPVTWNQTIDVALTTTGASLKGTLRLESKTSDAAANVKSCTVTVNVSGRRFVTDNEVLTSGTGG